MKTGQGGSRRRDNLRRMRALVAEERQSMRVIATVADVFAHFGADYDPELSLAENNKRLDRRV